MDELAGFPAPPGSAWLRSVPLAAAPLGSAFAGPIEVVLARGMQKRAASAAQPGPALGGSACLNSIWWAGRAAPGSASLKAGVIKAFVELRCDMLCLSELGEVQEGLESAFAEAEFSSGVAQPALQEVHEGDWGIYPRGHYMVGHHSVKFMCAWCPGGREDGWDPEQE